MNVTNPAVSTWHRKLIGEMAKRCIDVLTIYEELDCFCFLGNPPTRKPCVNGSCTNITDMPRAVMDTMFAYAECAADLGDVEELANSRLCFSGPSWVKPLVTLAAMGPKEALGVPSPFALLDADIAEFIENYE